MTVEWLSPVNQITNVANRMDNGTSIAAVRRCLNQCLVSLVLLVAPCKGFGRIRIFNTSAQIYMPYEL